MLLIYLDHRTSNIEEHVPVLADQHNDSDAHSRYAEIIQRKRLVDMAKAQAQEVAVMRAEVERLRMRTFPALVQVEHWLVGATSSSPLIGWFVLEATLDWLTLKLHHSDCLRLRIYLDCDHDIYYSACQIMKVFIGFTAIKIVLVEIMQILTRPALQCNQI